MGRLDAQEINFSEFEMGFVSGRVHSNASRHDRQHFDFIFNDRYNRQP